MPYCYWNMVHNRCNYHFSFWAMFCPFTSLTAQKIKISKIWKTHLEISSFYTSVSKIMIICNTVPEIWHMAYVIIFHFGLFLALLPPPPPTAPKMGISNKWKKCLEKSSFYTSVPKIMVICYTDPETWRVMDVIIFLFGLSFALLSP